MCFPLLTKHPVSIRRIDRGCIDALPLMFLDRVRLVHEATLKSRESAAQTMGAVVPGSLFTEILAHGFECAVALWAQVRLEFDLA